MANTTGKKHGGRKKGTPNKVTQRLRERIDVLLEDSWNDVSKDLKDLTPKERIDVLTRLLEYSLPKLSRSESTHEIKENEEPQDLSLLTDEELHFLISIDEKLTQNNRTI